jgi:glucose/mannose-6-phosphate isomerase
MLDEFTLWSQKLKDGLQLAHDFHYNNSERLPKNIKKIVFLGMGGSGIAGRIVKTFLDKKSNIPTFVLDSPTVPAFVDTDTLAIVVSYSGNTWETIDAFEKLAEKFIPTIVISHDGKALEIAESKNIPRILLPESVQPRAALGHFLGIILGLFDLMGIMSAIEDIIPTFQKQADLYIPKFEDEGYFSDFLYAVENYDFFHVWGVSGDSAAFAYRAQTQFNENSKVRAVFSDFPECCHNLLVGFTDSKKVKELKPFVMLFYSDFLPSHLSIAINSTSELLKEQGVVLYKPPVLEDNWEGQLFHMILWSDFASYYLGKNRGVEVVPVKLIDELKEKHKQKGIK